MSLCVECKWGTETVKNGKTTYYCSRYDKFLSPYTVVKRCKYFVSKARDKSRRERGKARDSGKITQITLTAFMKEG